jgi:hypothetical protein
VTKSFKARDERLRKPPDPRLHAIEIAQRFDSPWSNLSYPRGSWAVITSSVRLNDGRIVGFHSPQVVSFNLLESNRHLLRAERLRKAVLSQTKAASDGSTTPTNSKLLLDALASAANAVFLAFSAIEGIANESIDELPDEASITVERKGLHVVHDKESMIRWLSVSQKLDLVVPMVTGEPSIKGSHAWGDFVHLRRLRDALVHLRPPERPPDPDKPNAYGQLLRGDGSDCTIKALHVVDAARPGWVEQAVRKAVTERTEAVRVSTLEGESDLSADE